MAQWDWREAFPGSSKQLQTSRCQDRHGRVGEATGWRHRDGRKSLDRRRLVVPVRQYSQTGRERLAPKIDRRLEPDGCSHPRLVGRKCQERISGQRSPPTTPHSTRFAATQWGREISSVWQRLYKKLNNCQLNNLLMPLIINHIYQVYLLNIIYETFLPCLITINVRISQIFRILMRSNDEDRRWPCASQHKGGVVAGFLAWEPLAPWRGYYLPYSYRVKLTKCLNK